MNKNEQRLKEMHVGQIQYLGRWVDKNTFRAFVYSKDGKEKLANSYQEFQELTSSGLWFDTKPVASKERKPKDVVCSTS